MAKQTESSTVSKVPHTWQEALKLWNAGDPVPAFHVESEGATQEDLWGEAFHCLAEDISGDVSLTAITRLTKREIDVVNSIIHVAKLKPWPQMISSHVSASSQPLMIRKPKWED